MKSCSPWVIQQQKSAVPFPFMSLLVSLFMFLPFRHLARVLPFLPFLPDHTAYQHGYEWVSQRAYVAHLGQCHCADHSPVHIWTPSFQVSVPWQRCCVRSWAWHHLTVSFHFARDEYEDGFGPGVFVWQRCPSRTDLFTNQLNRSSDWLNTWRSCHQCQWLKRWMNTHSQCIQLKFCTVT